MSTDTGPPRPFVLLSILTLAAGAASVAISWSAMPPALSPRLVLLVLAAVLSENFALALPAFSVSMSYPLTMGAIVFAGPAAAGIVAAVSSTNYQELRSHRPWSVIAFNLGQLVTITSLGGWVYYALDGKFLMSATGVIQPMTLEDFPELLVPMAVSALTCAGVNLLLTGIGVSLMQQRPLGTLMRQLLPFVPTQVAMGFVGYLLAQVLAIRWIALVLFILPLMIASRLYERYSALRSAYVDTVRSLVRALEAKDPYTRGHSERVAEYAVAIGKCIGFDDTDCERLEYAALLHDLGKLALNRDILAKPSRLSDDEQCKMRRHPEVGALMVARVPVLRDLSEYVLLHHERYDGAGYPGGVTGEAIPLIARVLSVADSFDAMTTTRAYRPALSQAEALDELHSGAGTQFDPLVVDAFCSGLESRQIPMCAPRAVLVASPLGEVAN